MSGISLVTALIIEKNNPENLLVASAQDQANGKWSGLIYLLRGKQIHTTLISTKPVFETKEEAERHMQDLIDRICSDTTPRNASVSLSQQE